MRAPLRLATLVAVILALALLAGCSTPTAEPTPTARPVTTEESQLLAITRFTNFDTGSRPFHTQLTVSGVETEMMGWVDYASALGFVSVTGSFGAEDLLWTNAALGAIPREPDADGNPVLPIPDLTDPGWQVQALDPAASGLDAMLAAISALGSDRPDNPLLVQQSGALWLRDDTIDGTPVTVFAAPPSDDPAGSDGGAPQDASLRLWVTAAGLLLRAEVRLNNVWNTVDFPDAAAPTLEMPAGIG
ncbi:hypothetical protein BH09ACT4_BH09ACT4_11020 [soil metagenome]